MRAPVWGEGRKPESLRAESLGNCNLHKRGSENSNNETKHTRALKQSRGEDPGIKSTSFKKVSTPCRCGIEHNLIHRFPPSLPPFIPLPGQYMYSLPNHSLAASLTNSPSFSTNVTKRWRQEEGPNPITSPTCSASAVRGDKRSCWTRSEEPLQPGENQSVQTTKV